MLDRPEESIALLDEGSSKSQDELEQTHIQESRSQSTQSRWLLAALCLIVTIDLGVYLYVFRTVLKESESEFGDLEFRNPYVGLDELYRGGWVNASHYDPIVNVPRVAAQVSSAEPDKSFSEDEHRWLSNAGTMTPLDRRLQVSSRVRINTIIQFRAMDYGMEQCALALRLPSPEDKQDWTPGGPVRLDICALDVSRPLNPRTLSWSNRPDCISHIGTMAADVGEEVQLPGFSCSWGSLHTYEVSCASDSPESCEVDIWANRNGTWGIFMYQFQTV